MPAKKGEGGWKRDTLVAAVRAGSTVVRAGKVDARPTQELFAEWRIAEVRLPAKKDASGVTRCECTTVITYVAVIENRETGIRLNIGSECINWVRGQILAGGAARADVDRILPDVTDIFRSLAEVSGDQPWKRIAPEAVRTGETDGVIASAMAAEYERIRRLRTRMTPEDWNIVAEVRARFVAAYENARGMCSACGEAAFTVLPRTGTAAAPGLGPTQHCCPEHNPAHEVPAFVTLTGAELRARYDYAHRRAPQERAAPAQPAEPAEPAPKRARVASARDSATAAFLRQLARARAPALPDATSDPHLRLLEFEVGCVREPPVVQDIGAAAHGERTVHWGHWCDLPPNHPLYPWPSWHEVFSDPRCLRCGAGYAAQLGRPLCTACEPALERGPETVRLSGEERRDLSARFAFLAFEPEWEECDGERQPCARCGGACPPEACTIAFDSRRRICLSCTATISYY